MKLTIGSRGSRLALWQAAWIREQLRAVHPELDLSIEIIKTTGDEMKSAPLSVIGGKGVFTKEIDDALLNRRIDLAVHSLKDLPTVIPDRLTLAAITEREDARDALLLRSDAAEFYSSLRALPPNSVIGTSSPRRTAQLRNLLPNVVIKELRGNVDTRVAKLDRGEYDAIILASAGLLRLELKDRISIALPHCDMLPAIGQGALAVEVRTDDIATAQLVALLDHLPTRQACTAERSFLQMLGGGCELPIAGHAVVQDDQLQLEGLVAQPSGNRILRDEVKGKATEAVNLGQSLGTSLLAQGANQLLTS